MKRWVNSGIDTTDEVLSFQRAIGSMIKKERVRRELDQTQLAQVAGISNSYLSLIENGKRDVSTDILVRIARALNCTFQVEFVDA